MKEKLKIKITPIVVPILGLVLLLSPCKVRNLIQAQLGVPQTEVANKSKSTFSNSNCADSEIATPSLIKTKSHSPHLPTPLAGYGLTLNKYGLSSHCIRPHKARNHPASTIALYLLFQNFKDYL